MFFGLLIMVLTIAAMFEMVLNINKLAKGKR